MGIGMRGVANNATRCEYQPRSQPVGDDFITQVNTYFTKAMSKILSRELSEWILCYLHIRLLL